MRIDNSRLNMALARNCKTLSALRSDGVSPATLTRVRKGEDIKPATLGKIAKALGVDPAELIEKEA